MISRHVYSSAIVCAITLAFAQVILAQKSADPAQLIKASVAIDTDTISRRKPAIVTVTIENVSGSEVDLKAICSFEMLSMDKEAIARKHEVFGDRYWSPVNLLTAEPLKLNVIDPELMKKGVVVGRVPEGVLQFAKDETKTFKLDLTKLLWNASGGNDWPRWNLIEVVRKGPYTLVFQIEISGTVKSNEVKVSVE